jgi:hypothetical protein
MWCVAQERATRWVNLIVDKVSKDKAKPKLTETDAFDKSRLESRLRELCRCAALLDNCASPSVALSAKRVLAGGSCKDFGLVNARRWLKVFS